MIEKRFQILLPADNLAPFARRIPLSMLGILQYIAPTLQFLLGVFLYGELLDQTRMVGFSLIWMALLIYSIDGSLVRRRKISLQYSD